MPNNIVSASERGLPFQQLSRRRAVIGLGAAAAAGASIAAVSRARGESHSDAELLRLGEEFERRHAAWLPIYWRWHKLHGEFEEVVRKDKIAIDYDVGSVYRELHERLGARLASDDEEEAYSSVDQIAGEICELEAKTFVGLAVKLRALRFNCHLSNEVDLAEDDQDWPEYCFGRFIAEFERFAAAQV
jgi:hypothetical protein